MQTPSLIDAQLFRRTCSLFATGVAVATVADPDGTPYGLTVNSFTSVSCCPPLVLICVDYRCSILHQFRANNYYGINVLSDTQRDLSVRFSQRKLGRFEGLEWWKGESGVPLLGGCLASFECCVSQTVEAGDHALFIAEVTGAQYHEGRPLLYFGSSYQRLAD
jgi:flavin reductase (DIM6/NTAB) family NADH-FMN oxidoreductase RutF